MLQIRGVTKRFHSSGKPVLENLDLEVKQGEFFSLLGPSGCGKTTLMRIIAGFEQPSSGEIFFEGQRIDGLPAAKRPINIVFQKYALFPHLSVWENVAFGLKVKKFPKDEIQERVAQALDLVKMSDFADRMPATLSGGQAQRIAIARAIVNRPKILLLDEPLSALDLKLRQQMQSELLALQQKLKMTFIFVTHDQDEALLMSTRIAVLNQGKIEQIGTAQEVYETPATSFVADFIGSANLLNGQISDQQSLCTFVQGASKRPYRVSVSPGCEIGKNVRVMVRPEKLRILKNLPSSDQNYIESQIKEIFYHGPVTQFFVNHPDSVDATLLVTQPNLAMNLKRQFSVGEKVFLAWDQRDSLIVPESQSK